MNRKLISSLLLVLFVSIGLLAALFRSASLPNTYNNGFARSWQKTAFIPLTKREFEVPLQKICGVSKSNIYFSIPNPQGIIRFDKLLNDQDTLLYGLNLSQEMLGTINIFVDSPRVFFLADKIRMMFAGAFGKRRLDTLHQLKLSITRAVKIPSGDIVIRGLDSTFKKQIFQKINVNTGKIVLQEVGILDQGIGGFENDGVFQYDEHSHRIFYIESYRNVFYCLDTNLKIIYTGHTIDTISKSTSPIEILKENEKDRFMPSKHRMIVNEDAFIGKGTLFVLSGLKADNELKSDFNNNLTFDMYKISDGKYLGSFHIPRFQNQKVKSMVMADGFLYVLYKKAIFRFGASS